MQCSEMIKLLNQLAPEDIALSWDNPGLLAGRSNKEVRTIYLALDADDQVIEDAISQKADMLLTHHPLIFKPVKKINDQDFIGRRILRLIQASRLGLTEEKILEQTGEMDGCPCGIGKTGRLPQAESLKHLAVRVKEAFGIPFVTVYGNLQEDKLLERCAVVPGSGGSMIQAALDEGAQVLITGDIGHHQGIDSLARGMAVIDAGHYGLEHIFMDFMETYLEERLQGQVEIKKAPVTFPSAVI